jgi:S-formylglutathione hydrolase FrmB
MKVRELRVNLLNSGVLAFLATLVVVLATPALHSPAAAVTAKIDLGKLVELRIPSPEADYPIRSVFVWTPALLNVNPNSLPVVYMLHGWSGSPAGIISAVQKPLAQAFANGAKPFIAVFPDGNAKTHPDSEWADSSDKKAMVETWLTTKVIPKVESGRIRSASERAIMGFSMGGYGAAIIALHHPDLFSQIVSISGYFVTDDLTEAFASTAKVAYQSPANYLKRAPSFRWYLAEGKEDYTVPIRGQAASWSKKLASVKASVSLTMAAGGHSFVVVSNQMVPMTKWLKWLKVTSPTPIPNPTSSANPTPSPSSSSAQPIPSPSLLAPGIPQSTSS